MHRKEAGGKMNTSKRMERHPINGYKATFNIREENKGS